MHEQLLGKLPPSIELRRAMDSSFFCELNEHACQEQSVQEFMAAQPRAILTADRLQLPIAVCGIDIQDIDALWLSLLKAYLDLQHIQSIEIAAFSRNRLRLLERIAGNCKGIDELSVMEIAKRQCPVNAGTILVLTKMKIIKSCVLSIRSLLYNRADGQVVQNSTQLVQDKVVVLLSTDSMLDFDCVMFVLGSILKLVGFEVCHVYSCLLNSKALMLCPICLRKLSLVIPQFNIVRRYENLCIFFTQQSSSWAFELTQWCSDRLKYITNGAKERVEIATSSTVDKTKLQLLRQKLAKRQKVKKT